MRQALGEAWLPLFSGALIVVATYGLFQTAADRQLAVIATVCQAEAGRVQLELAHELDSRAGVMERLAAAKADAGDDWRAEADAVLEGEAQFRAIMAFDSSLAPGEARPPAARELSILDPHDDGTRVPALRVATELPGREAVVVSTAPLAAGERQVLVCAPVMRGRLRTGWLVGVTRLPELVDAALARTTQAGFDAGVFEGPTLLHGVRTDDGGPGVRFARDAVVVRGPLLWRVAVWPDEELTRRLQSWDPIGLFITGMLLAFFVALSIHLWREQAAGSRS